jgi:hypothetical protein
MTMAASIEPVIAVLSGSPRSSQCRLASKSPIVVPAVRADTMLAQYQGFDTSPRDDRRDTKKMAKKELSH